VAARDRSSFMFGRALVVPGWLTVFALMVAGAWPLSAQAEVGGTSPWRPTEIKLPTNASTRPLSGLYGVACTGAADCVAGGSYYNKADHEIPMIVTGQKGRWTRAFALRLPSTSFDRARQGLITAIACPAKQACIAVGYLGANFNEGQGFIATQSSKGWAVRVAPTPAKAAAKPYAELEAITCDGPGYCEAVGFYTNSKRHTDAIAITRTRGKWGSARIVQMPANGATGPDTDGYLAGITCPKPGSCLGDGGYEVAPNDFHAFEDSESSGRWHRATEVNLPSNASAAPDAGLGSISCVSASECVAVGNYLNQSGSTNSMSVTWSKGRWSPVTIVIVQGPDSGSQPSPGLYSVSCYAKKCQGVGSYLTASGATGWFGAVWEGGKWKPATRIPLPANSSPGLGQSGFPYTVSCTPVGWCTVVGDYGDRTNNLEPTAVTRSS
jgi:hypothetical protein